ncbi:MAG: cyclodeaminase/cyclohydrolase family protein [Deltaproteobacteria bacterium]|jgi:formiminotetrahydrofolate cyclodeaminase|nr:cyclodeaminase/cyclohydrolase family protein [Deltaproteobacteria bacterium]
MRLAEQSCEEFVAALASKAPVPGGGSASALVAALGAALGSMVGNLTLGKKKYAAVQAEIAALLEKARAVQAELLALAQRDAEAFEPLSRAYGLPQETDQQKKHKTEVLEQALWEASAVPLLIMEQCAAALELHARFAQKGSALALSDAGAGAAICQGALKSAALNVFINVKAMLDRPRAEELKNQAHRLLEETNRRAEAVYQDVLGRLL